MVDLALSSVALVVFAHTQHHPPAAKEASSRFHRLLGVARVRIARLTVPELDEQDVDACLLAVCLMGRYEGAMLNPGSLNGADFSPLYPRWSHHDGVQAILRVWYEKSNKNKRSPTFIVKQTRRELIRSSILRDLPLPGWMQDGSRFGEQGPELAYDRIVARVVNLHHEATKLRLETGVSASEGERLNNEAQDLDDALHNWTANIPGPCFYQRHVITDTSPWPRKHFYSPKVYSYPEPAYSSAWCQYFAMSMIIHSARYEALELIRWDPSVTATSQQEWHECNARLQTSANNLASSIPFCLGRFTVNDAEAGQPTISFNTKDEIKPGLAHSVTWPLFIASSLEGIDIELQKWFLRELASLERTTGDGVSGCAKLLSMRCSEREKQRRNLAAIRLGSV